MTFESLKGKINVRQRVRGCEEWQDIWNSAASNKLHAIYPVVGTSCHNKFTSRREAVII